MQVKVEITQDELSLAREYKKFIDRVMDNEQLSHSEHVRLTATCAELALVLVCAIDKAMEIEYGQR